MGLMSTLTGLLYGALVVYLGGWFFGYWIGNFALLLLILTLVTLGYWLAERFAFRPARQAAAAALESQFAAGAFGGCRLIFRLRGFPAVRQPGCYSA